jgi:hypothetical protein
MQLKCFAQGVEVYLSTEAQQDLGNGSNRRNDLPGQG